MAAEPLITSLTVTNLPPQATVTLAHGLSINGVPTAPDAVHPTSPTPIGVLSVDATSITFKNYATTTLSAVFTCRITHTLQRGESGATDIWLGGQCPCTTRVTMGAVGNTGTADTITIYVRNSGNDDTGDGSLENPYRTTPRALMDVAIPATSFYIIDTTGVTETWPASFALPPFSSSLSWQFDFGQTWFARFAKYPIALIADLETLMTVPIADVASQVHDPIDDLIRVTVNGVAWTPGEFVGKFANDTNLNSAVIHDNGADWIDVASNVNFSADIAIQQCSWNVTFEDDGTGNAGMETVGLATFFLMAGAKITRPAGTPSVASVQVESGPGILLVNCDLDGVTTGPTNGTNASISACVVRNIFYDLGGEPYTYNSYWKDVAMHVYGGGGRGEAYYYQDVFDHCDPVGHSGNSEVEETFQLNNCRIRNSTSYALAVHAGSCSANQMKLEGCHQGINVTRPCYAELNGVGGDPPAVGPGLTVDDGAHVRIDATYSLTGPAGDLLVGQLAARSLAHFRAGDDGRPAKNQYDGDAMAGTGSRVWQP